jgi:hypothetical protein
MRMIMGLDRPTSGTVTVNGKPYRQHRAPLREVGALLEASAVQPPVRAGEGCRPVTGDVLVPPPVPGRGAGRVPGRGEVAAARRRAPGWAGGAGFGMDRPVRGDPAWAVAANSRWTTAASETWSAGGSGWRSAGAGGMVAVPGSLGTVAVCGSRGTWFRPGRWAAAHFVVSEG